MKKLLSGLLAAVLCAGLSVSAFAAETFSETVTISDGDKITFEQVTFKESGALNFDTATMVPDRINVTIYHVVLNSKITTTGKYIVTLGYNPPGFMSDNWRGNGGGPTDGPSDKVDSTMMLALAPLENKILYTADQTPLFGASAAVKAPAEPAKAEAAKPAAPVTPAATATPAATEAAAPATRVAVGGDQLYTVAMGDTFGVLALNYFGDMSVWRGIYNYNIDAIEAAPNKQFFEGMEILIPHAIQHGEKIFNAIAPASASGNEKLYTVAANDTYGSIAQAHFGDASRYEEIFNRNADRLVDLNTLYAGQVIVLP